MRSKATWREWLVTGLIGALVVFAVARWRDEAPSLPAAAVGLTPSELLGGEADGEFATATAAREFRFPDDHGAHPAYRTEWWYFTGNVTTTQEPRRDFGFQLTFFRYAIARATAAQANGHTSAWRTSQVYMAHIALTDIATGRHLADERFSRAALDLAGANAAPFAVWLGDWRAASIGDTLFPLSLTADAAAFSLALELHAGRPLVLQGKDGLSAKGPEPGNASYYYSFTRLPVTGRIVVGDTDVPVAGTAWLDREWSTSALDEKTPGWDWFALQLDDGSDLMFYRLRDKDGRAGASSAGIVVSPNGETTGLAVEDVDLTVTRRWQSRTTDIAWPVGWRLSVARLGLELDLSPRLDDQEMNLSVVYWEGAMSVSGKRYSRPVSGVGYLELAGYDN